MAYNLPLKLPVRKPEMWPRKGLMKRLQPIQGIEGYGGGPLWRQRPALGCSANEEEEEEEEEEVSSLNLSGMFDLT